MNWVWRASAQILLWFLRRHSILVPLGTFCFGFFGDILIAVWGGPLLYIEGIFWGSRRPYDDSCYVLFKVAQYAIYKSFQAIQYARGIPIIRLSDLLFCTLYICIYYLLSVMLTYMLTLQMIM